MLQDPVLKAVRSGQTFIDKSKIEQPIYFQMLGSLNNKRIIEKVKAPLMWAIIKAAKLFPKATRENTYLPDTRDLMNIFDEFFLHFINRSRREMMEAGRDVALAEIEHDPHYAWIFCWFAQEIAKAVNDGKFKLDKPFPIKGCWKE